MSNGEERQGILNFVSPNFLEVPVLVIEAADLLSGLREILPAAKIALMTTERTPKVERLCEGSRADLIVGDWERGDLPNTPKIFELIVAPYVLTTGENFYATLLTLNHLLKDSGYLLTQFRNVRYIGVLEALKSGRFSANEERFWAKADVVKLLDDAVYKEIRFMPHNRAKISADEWENFGFDNFSDDLTTKIWLVKACKCTAEVAALKDIFTHEIRAELSRLLHRIEYDLNPEENFQRLANLCRREGIFEEYLNDFVNQVVVHDAAKNFIRERAEKIYD
ncbi:MAG: methyltransferase [Selenomonadaceae bacterium]|nr:methyltransferase [Selenomonadaceae bacterium]